MKQTTKESMEKNNKKSLMMVIAIMFIALVLYNVIIFFTFGFKNHNTVFWFSYSITIIGALSVATSLIFLGPIRAFLRDWLFGFPIVRYGAIYCVLQYTASVAFMRSETVISSKIVYPLQSLLFGAYLILLITCFLTKDNIKQTEQINFDRTLYMKQLRVQIASLSDLTESAELKQALATLSDEAKSSDPVSADHLAAIEKKLSEEVLQCHTALDEKNDEKAMNFCRLATRTLKERNEQCKTFKRNV